MTLLHLILQAYHLFHTSCLLHWSILCQYEMLTDQLARKGKSNRGRKAKNAPKKTKITSIFCPECQGTGTHVKGDELEKPSISLSEVWSTISLLYFSYCFSFLSGYLINLPFSKSWCVTEWVDVGTCRCFALSWKPLKLTKHGWRVRRCLRTVPLGFISPLSIWRTLR